MNADHPFLGPSANCMPARNGYTLNPDPMTPQPVAPNVAPPGMEKTVRALKQEPNVDNPYALAWWMKGHQR